MTEMKPLTRILLALACLLVAIWLVAPTLVVVPMSFNGNKSLAFPPQGFSWQWYRELLHQSGMVEQLLQFAEGRGRSLPCWRQCLARWLLSGWPA